MTTITNASQVAVALMSIKGLDAEIARLTTLRQQHVNDILDNTKGTGAASQDGIGFTLSENNTYDQKAMLDALKPGQVVRCQVRKLDNSLVKALYPKVHAAAKRSNGRKFSLKG